MAPSAESTTAKALAFAVNVKGTENVIAACQHQGVPKLIYTSSASVVFSGRDLDNIDESFPYAVKVPDFYAETKASILYLVNLMIGTLASSKILA